LEAEDRATGTSFRKLDNVIKAKKNERNYLKYERGLDNNVILLKSVISTACFQTWP
jgi:hypothetical protein